MNKPIKFLPLAVFAAGVFSVSAFAQSNRTVEPIAAATNAPAGANVVLNSTDVLSNELAQLRKTLQSLNSRLRDLNPNSLTPGAKIETVEDRQKKILKSLEILNSSEQRAELLRRQLVESVEKETSIRSRVIGLEEEMRPENIERNMNSNLSGSTRAPEQRDARRRSLENERNGLRSLLGQIEQSRQRLEDDLRNADQLVVRLRQRVLPLIEREVDNLTSP
jgi:chromosome segregation ATPase